MFRKSLTAVLCASILAAGIFPAAGVSASEDTESDTQLTVGIALANVNSQPGSLSKALIDAAARVLDVHVEYLVHGNNVDNISVAAQFLIDAGCDGIVFCGIEDTELSSILQTCAENEVYLAQALGAVDENPEDGASLYSECQASEWYAGAVRCPEYDTGTADTDTIGGIYCEPLYAFMLIYGALEGSISDTAGTLSEIAVHGIDISDAQSSELYQQYFTEKLPYTEQELEAMGNMSAEELAETAAALSLEDVQERLGGA